MNQPLSRSSNNSANPATGSPGPQSVPNIPEHPVASSAPQPYTPVFTTDKIQHTKATRPKTYFDEQNKKNAEEKKRDTKNRRNIIIVGAAIVGSLVLIGLIWFIVIKLNEPKKGPTGVIIPVVTNGNDEEVNKVQNYLQGIYDDAKDNSKDTTQTQLDAVNTATEDILEVSGGDTYLNQVNLAKLKFYYDNNLLEQVLNNQDSVDPDALELGQQAAYYNILSMTYLGMGNNEQGNAYMRLAYKALYELNGPAEDTDEDE